MPLITDNLIVGGKEAAAPVAAPPLPITKHTTNKESNPRFSFGNFIDLSAKPEEPKVIKKIIKEVVQVTPPPPAEKYLKKKDGELIRHINKKSHYLRDVFEDF